MIVQVRTYHMLMAYYCSKVFLETLHDIRPTLHWESGPKILGANFGVAILGLQISALGPIQGHNVQHLVLTRDKLKFLFSISALTPSVKAMGLLSTFAPIGMLDLGRTLAPTPSVKRN